LGRPTMTSEGSFSDDIDNQYDRAIGPTQHFTARGSDSV
jgi:hypothetical protein